MAPPNYLTATGAQRLAEELRRLREVERPRVVQEVAEAAAQGDRSENAEYIYGKKRLREIDRRMRFLTKRLESAEVVREVKADGVIRFGTRVVLEDESGARRTYVLVGPDESDPGKGLISIRSPLGLALLKRRVGDIVTVQRPSDTIEYEIMEVTFPDLDEVHSG